MAAVRTASRFRVTPGKNQEFQSQVAEAKGIISRLGGRVRVWQATIAGENTGQVAVVVEHDDIVAYANFQQKLTADAGWLALIAKVGANPTATPVGMSLATELEL